MTSPWYNPTLVTPNTRALAEAINNELKKIQAAFDQLPPPGSVGTGTSPTFVHFAYADSLDGTRNFTTGAPGNRRYIGVQANVTSPEPSEFPADYTWSLLTSGVSTGEPDEDLIADINEALANSAAAIAAAATAQGTADGKVTTFFQDEAPVAESVGDLWIDTNDGNKLYRWSGTAWNIVRDAGIGQAINAASNAQATADGKIVSFFQDDPPSGAGEGDFWIDTNDNNRLYRWSGTEWSAGPTRNEDGGGNMIAEADTLKDVTFAIAGSLQTVNNQPVAALVGAAFSAVLFGYVPVRGGERLFFGYTGFSDVSNGDSIRAGYNWIDAAGNIFAVDLPQTAMNGTEAVGFANGKRVGEFAVIPDGAIRLQMYVIRPTWGGNGTFFVRRPLLSRSQPGATDGAPAGSMVGGTEASSLAAQAVAAYRPRQNLLFNGRFQLGLNGWDNISGAWRFVRDNRGQFVEQPLGTGGTFVLRSQQPIFAGSGAPMVISLQGFADFAAVDTVLFADIEWRNGTNDTVLGFSSFINGNGAIIASIVPAGNPAYNSQAITAPNPTDGSGFVRGFVRLVSAGTVPYNSGGRVALGVKVEAGTTPSAMSDEATDGAVLDKTFGRIRDPEAYNTQAILGPRNTTNLVPTYTVGGSNVTVNLPAHSRIIATRSGPRTLGYGASSGVVGFSTYWAAYIDDPELTGFASPSVVYTGNPSDLLFPGRYQISSGFTPNAAGSGGGAGAGGGAPQPILPPSGEIFP